jgi:ABC-type spermidine/putrescine transport system permease subunit I
MKAFIQSAVALIICVVYGFAASYVISKLRRSRRARRDKFEGL